MNTVIESTAGILLFGSFIYFIGMLLALVFFLFYSEGKENGFIAFVAVGAFLVMSHFWGNYNLFELITVKGIVGYLVTGFLFSLLRTYFFGRKKLGDYMVDDEANKARAIRDRKSELKGNVFRWWFIWPISLVSWVTTDMFKVAWDWTYDKTSKIYNHFLDMGLKVHDKND